MGGSLAPFSTSLAALNVAIRGAREAGTDVDVFDIRSMNLPMYAPNLEPPDQAVRLCDAIYAAEGLIWSSPLYHGTISGSFKNALDWLELLQHRNPPYLTDKVVGLISSAGGVQGPASREHHGVRGPVPPRFRRPVGGPGGPRQTKLR